MNRQAANRRQSRPASVLVLVVFIIAMMSAIVIGMLEVNTEEIQLMRNYVHAAEALAIAEAGLNDAFSHLRMDSAWNAGFTDKPFGGGHYTVAVDGRTIRVVGTNSTGGVAALEAEVVVSSVGPPHLLAIHRLRINPDGS